MNIGRTYRTVRHLSRSQLFYRLVCRGKFAAMARWPEGFRSHFERRAEAFRSLGFSSPRLAAVTAHVAQLQRAVHGEFLNGVPEGRFTLLNRQIDFRSLENIEWRRDLGESNNRLWRMTLSYMGYLVPLTEDKGAAAVPVIRALLASMNAQNPWSSPGVFRDVWHPYSVSHRVINLLACMSLLAKQGVVLEADEEEDIAREIRLGTAFVLGNLERDLQYNHLFKNLVCLSAVAASMEDKHNPADAVLNEVAASIDQQFLTDGGHTERAPMYHLLSLLDLRILRDSGALRGKSAAAVAEALAKGEAAANAMIHPDGDVALFNDSWLGEAPRAADLVPQVKPNPAEPCRTLLPKTGYVRLAVGGDSVVMDCGACGPDANPGHAHADFLSLELSVGGVRAIVDPGVPTYSEGALRDTSRSASAHNGPSIEGIEPIEFWRSFRVGRRGYAYPLELRGEGLGELCAAGWQNGYRHGGTIVARAIALVPERGLLVADLWIGRKQAEERSVLTLAESWRPLGNGRFVAETAYGETGLALHALAGRLGTEAPQPYWFRFGQQKEGTRLPVFADGEGAVRTAGFWLDWSGRDATPLPQWQALQSALLASLRAAIGPGWNELLNDTKQTDA